jgi:hypothetical protein
MISLAIASCCALRAIYLHFQLIWTIDSLLASANNVTVMTLLWLILGIIVLAIPPAIFFGNLFATITRPVRDWVRWIRLRRRANRLLLPR